MADISENIFQSIDILIEKQLQSLQFDITVEATIVDASKASTGEYIVSTGNASFKAFSTETGYKKNDAVMVNIPQGDYSKNKTIIGKQVDKMNTPMVYKSPFQELIDVSTNLIDKDISVAMWANSGEQYGWSIDKPYFYDSEAYNRVKEIFSQNSDNNVNNDLTNEELKLALQDTALLWDSNDQFEGNGQLFESRFTRLGIKADFSTWLNEYNTAYGNYGLAVLLLFGNNDNTGLIPQFITFDSDEFFGDVYNFESYYTQEALFDISEFVDYPIRRILLFAYQRNNFKDEKGNLIYQKQDLDSLNTIQPNIYIKDIYLCLGMPTSEFNLDTAEIITNSSSTYTKALSSGETGLERLLKNEKILGLRWIHKDIETETIATVLPEKIPSNYKIYWYRYKIGAPSPDEFAGAHWERFYGANSSVIQQTDNTKKLIVDKNEEYNFTQEQINQNGELDVVSNHVDNIYFYPNVNRESEQIKAIIIKEEPTLEGIISTNQENTLRMIAATPIIKFTNETDVRSEATFIDENALSIRFDDETSGNYAVYNRAGTILKQEHHKLLRTLTAVFDEEEHNVYKKHRLEQPYTSIKWSFPATDSMIVPSVSTAEETAVPVTSIDLSNYSYINLVDEDTAEPFYEFTYTREDGSTEDSSLVSVGYFIKKDLNHNANRNTVSLTINKDGQEYIASVTMRFNSAGSSGSDYTISLEWLNNNAFEIVQPYSEDPNILFPSLPDGIQEPLKGQIKLLDSELQEVLLEEPSKYELSWYKVVSQDNNENDSFEYIAEEKDLYYPVENAAVQPLNDWSFTNTTFNNLRLYYLISKNHNEGSGDYYYYDLTTKTFKNNQGYDANKILYRKLAQSDKKRPIITFQEKKIDSNTYSDTQRYFIKRDGIYIIDPWSGFQATETYYEPVISSKKNYENASLKIIQNNQNTIGNLFSIAPSSSNNKIPNINDLYILEIKLINFGDYNLIARFPVPLKTTRYNVTLGQKDYSVRYIEGPTEVRYSTNGEIDFKKGPYQILYQVLTYDQQSKNGEKNYSYIKLSQGYDSFEEVNFSEDVFLGNNKQDNYSASLEGFIGHWELIYENSNNNQNKYFLPELVESNENASSTKLRKPILKPPGTFFEDTPLYGVKFVVDHNIHIYHSYKEDGWKTEDSERIHSGTVLWTQPIYVYQDNYPSTTLNKWSGKDIQTDEAAGTMTANGFSAGKKESDNSFTGVMLGDWSRSDVDAVIAKRTGIYGFNHGKMSYALQDDGKAFFGKEGSGRIYFDGNKAQIYSANWITPEVKTSGKYGQAEKGMLIDIDDGQIKINDSNTKSLIQVTGDNKETLIKPGYFKLTVDNNKNLLEIKSEKTENGIEDTFYLQSRNFSTDGDGSGVKFNLATGKLTGYNFMIQAGTSNKKLIIDSNPTDGRPLKINGNNFYVTWDGLLHSINGNIGGWSVGPDSITNGNTPYAAGAEIKSGIGLIKNVSCDGDYNNDNNSKSIFFAGSRSNKTEPFKFQVGSDGKLYAKEAEIEGKINAKSGNIGNWIIKNNRLQSDNNDGDDCGVYLSPTKIKLGTKFSVNSDGKLEATDADIEGKLKSSDADIKGKITATSGKIGGWNISNGNLTAGSLTLNSNGSISNGNFKVSSDGELTAKSGTIGGWTIGTSSISKGSITLDGSNGSIRSGDENTSTKIDNNGKLIAKNVDISGKLTSTNADISGKFTAGDFFIAKSQSEGKYVSFEFQTNADEWAYTMDNFHIAYLSSSKSRFNNSVPVGIFGISATKRAVYCENNVSINAEVQNTLLTRKLTIGTKEKFAEFYPIKVDSISSISGGYVLYCPNL